MLTRLYILYKYGGLENPFGNLTMSYNVLSSGWSSPTIAEIISIANCLSNWNNIKCVQCSSVVNNCIKLLILKKSIVELKIEFKMLQVCVTSLGSEIEFTHIGSQFVLNFYKMRYTTCVPKWINISWINWSHLHTLLYTIII